MKYIPQTNVPLVVLTLVKSNTQRQESYSQKPYYDNSNQRNITIGYGYNLTARGLPKEWAEAQFEEDVSFIFNLLKEAFEWFQRLEAVRQSVLIDIVYNIGWAGFLEFKNVIKYLEENDYKGAAKEMLNSDWAKEVKSRAEFDANKMETG